MFRDVSIFPSHNKKTAVVAWIVDPRIRDAEFYVYKKWDGGSEWELLSTSPTYGTTFVDTNFYIPNKEQVPAYRVLALLGDEEYISPDVALFSKIDRKAFGVAQNIIKSLYCQARADGIPVLYYPAIKNGKMSSSLDDTTGQRVSATCEDTDSDTSDYGTYYEHGYYRPFLTYIRPMKPKLVRQDRLDVGIFDSNILHTEFLAFPPVRTNDLVVDVSTDRRWFVGEGVTANLVKSVIPVSYNATLSLQNHNEPCYAVPVPSNYPELIRRLTWLQI